MTLQCYLILDTDSYLLFWAWWSLESNWNISPPEKILNALTNLINMITNSSAGDTGLYEANNGVIYKNITHFIASKDIKAIKFKHLAAI